jgi:hypothetical protein
MDFRAAGAWNPAEIICLNYAWLTVVSRNAMSLVKWSDTQHNPMGLD